MLGMRLMMERRMLMIEELDKMVVLGNVISRLIREMDSEMIRGVMVRMMEDVMWKDNVLRSIEKERGKDNE